MAVNNAVDVVTNVTMSVAPALRTANAAVNGTAIDLASQGGFMACLCIVDVGTRTDGTVVVKLQDSADNSTFADVTAANLSGAFGADIVTNTPVKVAYLGGKRYLRAVATQSGATSGATYGVLLCGMKPRLVPTTGIT